MRLRAFSSTQRLITLEFDTLGQSPTIVADIESVFRFLSTLGWNTEALEFNGLSHVMLLGVAVTELPSTILRCSVSAVGRWLPVEDDEDDSDSDMATAEWSAVERWLFITVIDWEKVSSDASVTLRSCDGCERLPAYDGDIGDDKLPVLQPWSDQH